MKKSIFFFILTFFFYSSGSSQSCLPEGIIFSNQASINNFQDNYPGCTAIEGDVTISGVNITNLNGLNVLTTIGGTLRIAHNDALINLTGLDNLTDIFGGLLLDTNSVLASLAALGNLENTGGNIRVAGNPNLADLTGLGSLHVISGDLIVSQNNILPDLTGLTVLETINGSLAISDNPNMTNFSGLNNLSAIQGNLDISSLNSLTSLQALVNLTTVSGDLTISHNNILISLSGLENINPGDINNLTISRNGDLTECEIASICEYLSNPSGSVNIWWNGPGCSGPGQIAESCGYTLNCLPHGNYYLLSQSDIDEFEQDYPGCFNLKGNVTLGGQNLQGLHNVTSIERDLTISSGNLTNLNGLDFLFTIGGNLIISDCNSLLNMTGLDYLHKIGGDFIVQYDGNLLNLLGLNHLDSIYGDLSVLSDWKMSSLTGLDSLQFLGQSLLVMGTEVLNLSGLENLDSIGGTVWISDNSSLTSLEGLENLEAVGEDLKIGRNDHIINLEPLESLNSVGGMLELSYSRMTSLDGLGNLDSVGGGFKLEFNDELQDIMALSNLKTIGGDIYIGENTNLTTLAGLDGIAAGSIEDLTVNFNPSLSECDVQSICDYLASPNGTVIIYGNGALGWCNSPQEVWLACTAELPEIGKDQDLILYPNPAINELYIIGNNLMLINKVTIYNQLGQRILCEQHPDSRIDISSLQPGIYIVEFVVGDLTGREKLTINR